jgi:hypothetical protein
VATATRRGCSQPYDDVGWRRARAATRAPVVAEAAHAVYRGAAACAGCSCAVVIAVGQRWWSTATRAAGVAASGVEVRCIKACTMG